MTEDHLPGDCSPVSRESPFGGALEKAAACVFAALVAYAVGRSIVAAASKPFWFDEMCTWGVASQPSFAAVSAATGRAIEPNPPPFYLVEHIFGGMLRNQEIAYRLASVTAFACVLVSVFLFVRRRGGALLALGCSAVLLVTIAFDRYAIDARPYSLELACIAFAMVCYQRAPARRWMIWMGFGLAMAEAFHYYAVFSVIPFVLAEAAEWWRTRRLRLAVWMALCGAFVPLAIFWPMLARVQAYSGPHFWANPTLRSATDTYGWFFEASLPARATTAMVLLLAACATILILSLRADARRAVGASAHFNEYVLIAALLGLPLITLAATRIAHGGMTARYALPALLGVPTAIGYLAARLKSIGIALLALCALLGAGYHEMRFWGSSTGHWGEVASPAKPLGEILQRADHDDLPVVISNGLDYLSIAHYAPPRLAGRLVALVDPEAQIAEMGNDSLDKGLLAIRCCLPIRVYEYSAFAAEHPVFLLYSDGDIDFDRWPERLMHKGKGLNILAVEGSRNLYLVDLADSSQ
jgi:hypothetical protein